MDEPERQQNIAAIQRRVEQIEADLQSLQVPRTGERTFDLRFISIRRTTDVAALVALLLAVVTLLLQLQARLATPILTAYPPRQIVVFDSDALKADITRLSNNVVFAATTSYSNTASVGHDAIILDEFIRVKIGSTRIQHWLIEVGSSDAAPAFKIVSNASRPVPFVVPSNGGFAHEVLFAPYSSPYCLPADTGCLGANTWYSWDEFRRDIIAAGEMEITLGAKLPDQTALLTTCTVKFVPGEKWITDVGDGRWWAPECF